MWRKCEPLHATARGAEVLGRSDPAEMQDGHRHLPGRCTLSCQPVIMPSAFVLAVFRCFQHVQDKDGMRTDDINALAGQRADKKGGKAE